MPSHLPLASRKALLGRLTAFELYQPHALGTARERAERMLEVMLPIFDAEAGKEQNNGVQLDTWFRETAAKISNIALALPGYREGPEMAKIAKGISADVSRLSCMVCGGGKVCQGRPEDDQIVTQTGACISRISELFAAAETITRSYYVQAPLHGEAAPVVFKFSTDHRPTKPHQVPVPFAVAGRMLVRDTHDGAESEIELLLAVTKLDWDGYLAALYVLLHECVCHAYAGLADASPRPPLQDHDMFAEGWMDWIVGRILEDLAAGTGPAAVASTLRFRAEACRVGQLFHLQRAQPRRDDEADAYGVAQAVRAATRTYEMLQRVLPATARDTMLTLSFDLNLLRRSAPEVARFLRTMDRHLGAPGMSSCDAIEGALRRYAGNLNVRQFLRELPSV